MHSCLVYNFTDIGLTPGKEYNIKGVLMDKSTGEKFLVDGKEVNAEATFIASKTEGSIDIPFTFDASGLAGKSVVVFESLYRDGLELAAHTDIDDEGQTIDFGKPDIQTTATIDGNKITDPLGEVTIVDTVEYTGLTIGKTYNVKGVLMDKSTNEKLLVDGKEITSSAEFTAEKENGTVEVTFTFDCSGLAGISISRKRTGKCVLWVSPLPMTSWCRRLSVCCWKVSMSQTFLPTPMGFGPNGAAIPRSST